MALHAAPGRAAGRSRRSRAFRFKVAGTLLAFAAAGLYASSQAMAQAPGAQLLGGGHGTQTCDRAHVGWGYEVDLVPGAEGGFSIAGVRMDSVPAACLGRPVTVTYVNGGAVVRRAVRPLVVGVVDRLDRSVVGDAMVTAASWAPAS